MDKQKIISAYARAIEAIMLVNEVRKEEWIDQYIFMAGEKWTDPPITREEAERVWSELHANGDENIT